MIPNEKFKFEIVAKGNQAHVFLKGTIDEDTDFSALKTAGPSLLINFKEVLSINSCGIRTWVNFLKEMDSAAIAYEECPPLIVRQMNMVPSFLGKAEVNSVFVPYVCEECEAEKLVLANSTSFKKGNLDIAETIKCDSCEAGEMELDGNPKQYFAFAK